MARTRRSILGSSAALLAAGCLGAGSGNGGTPTDTTDDSTPTDDETPTDAPNSPSLRSLSVHQSIALEGPVHTDVRGGVFLVARFADAAGGATLTLDGSSRDPITAIIDRQQNDSVAAFEFPTDGFAAGSGRLEWDDGSRSLSERLLERLRAPPQFVVREFSVPDETDPATDVTATVVVENTGPTDGRFLAEFGSTGVSDQSEITVEVPAGQTVTATRSAPVFRQEGETTIVLVPAGDRFERTVSLE